jgi:hypothetical protein
MFINLQVEAASSANHATYVNSKTKNKFFTLPKAPTLTCYTYKDEYHTVCITGNKLSFLKVLLMLLSYITVCIFAYEYGDVFVKK